MNQFEEQLFLTFRVGIVVSHDVAPDFNLLAGLQLEILRNFSALDSTNGTIGQTVFPLLGTTHAIEGLIGLLEHECCQLMCCRQRV